MRPGGLSIGGRVLALALSLAVPGGVASQGNSAAYEEDLEKGQLLLRTGKFEDAVKVLKRAVKSSGDTCAECSWDLAQAYWKLGASKNVIETCDKLIRIAADPLMQAQAHNLKGNALGSDENRKPERLREAENEYRAALQSAPNLQIAHYNLGLTMFKLNRDPEGIAEMKLYIERAPHGGFVESAQKYIENPRRARESYAPEFSLTTVQGEYLTLEDLHGKVVMLDFWATWCEPCREALPDLKHLYKKFDKEKFVVISVSGDSDEARWREFIEKNKMDWPQYRDKDGHMSHLFNIRPIPSYFVIDGEGIVRRQVIGWGGNQAAVLEDEIKKSLKALERK
jgi:peroxiredoxin